MNAIQRFGEYAAAFEKAYESDDWSVLDPYFTEDAVYEVLAPAPVGGIAEGRGKVYDHFKGSVDGFDRRFDVRDLQLAEGPELRDGKVWMRWKVTYRHPGVPEVVLEGESTTTFEGDRIARLEDRMVEASVKNAIEVLGANADSLRPVGG